MLLGTMTSLPWTVSCSTGRQSGLPHGALDAKRVPLRGLAILAVASAFQRDASKSPIFRKHGSRAGCRCRRQGAAP